MGTSLLANLIVVVAIQLVLGDLIFLPISRQHFVNIIASDALLNFLATGVPFLAIFGSYTVYLLPILSLYNGRSSEEQKQRAFTRMLNAPIVIGLVSTLGWIFGGAAVFIIYAAKGSAVDIYEVLNNIGVFSATGMMTFVLSYYGADIINRTLYIPHFMPNGISDQVKGAIPISLRFRLEVFVFAAAVAPILLMTLTATNFLMQSPSGIPPYVIYLSGLVFIFVALILAALLARFMQKPIGLMQQAVRRIRNLDFQVKLPVVSADEIGTLTQGINEMAASLAEKEKIKETFGRAVDPRVRDHMLSGKIDASGESLEVTVLFCDIRNFTSFSERRSPGQVVAWLNAYFEEMAKAIDAHDGVINKYIGDAIMAVFNAPVRVEEHAWKAVQAARDMLHRLKELNDRTASEADKIRIGIGLATGQVLAGNIGSRSRIEYTVIGDTVNTASRVEGLCKKVKVPLLLTGSVVASLQGRMGDIRRVGRARVKGKETLLELYTLSEFASQGSI